MVNTSLANASYRLLKSLLWDVQRRASSNIVIEENNLPPIFYCLFSKTDFNARCWAYVAFKCSSTVAITLSLCASELSPTSDKDAELNR